MRREYLSHLYVVDRLIAPCHRRCCQVAVYAARKIWLLGYMRAQGLVFLHMSDSVYEYPGQSQKYWADPFGVIIAPYCISSTG